MKRWFYIDIRKAMNSAEDRDFMADRENRLLAMIARATGHPTIFAQAAPEEGEDVPQDDQGLDLPAPRTEEAA